MGKLWEVGSSRSKCDLQILLSLVDPVILKTELLELLDESWAQESQGGRFWHSGQGGSNGFAPMVVIVI